MRPGVVPAPARSGVLAGGPTGPRGVSEEVSPGYYFMPCVLVVPDML
jgi:hypothetical protein